MKVPVHHVAFALLMGPGLVIAAVNTLWLELACLKVAPIGMPLSEAFPEPQWVPVQRAARHAFRTGMEVRMVREEGILWFIPYVAPNGRRGVVSHYRPNRVPLVLPAPALQRVG